MTQLYITEAGIAAANSSSPNGPMIQIVSFALGSDYGYTPPPSSVYPGANSVVTSQSALRGTVRYPVGNQRAVPSNYHLAADGITGVFTLVVGLDVGDFSFGEVALYMPGNVMFGIAVLPQLQTKLTTTQSQTGNIINMTVSFQLNGVKPNITVQNVTTALADIRTVGTVDVMSPPSASPTNNAISLQVDEYNRSNLMTKRDTDLWQSQQYDWVVHEGVVQVSGDKTLSDATLATSPIYVAPGRYILQFTSGALKGQVRQITAFPVWAASVVRRVGDVVQPTNNPNVLLRCTTAGTSGTAQPSWNTGASGATTTDGTAVWTYTPNRDSPNTTLSWAGSTSSNALNGVTYTVYRAASFSGIRQYIGEYMLDAMPINYYNQHH